MSARPTGGGLRVAEDDADLLAQLVDEDQGGVRARHRGGELAQRLRHQPRLQARQRVPHVALELRARHERGDGVDDDYVDGVRADQRLADLECLLAGVGLGDQQFVDVDATGGGVLRLEGVLDVDVGGGAACALALRDDVLGEGGLAGRLRPEDLRHAPSRYSADAEGDVEREGAGGDGGDVERGPVVPEAHDRALAEVLGDLVQRAVQIVAAPLLRIGLLARSLAGLLAGLRAAHGAILPRTLRLYRVTVCGTRGTIERRFYRVKRPREAPRRPDGDRPALGAPHASLLP